MYLFGNYQKNADPPPNIYYEVESVHFVNQYVIMQLQCITNYK